MLAYYLFRKSLYFNPKNQNNDYHSDSTPYKPLVMLHRTELSSIPGILQNGLIGFNKYAKQMGSGQYSVLQKLLNRAKTPQEQEKIREHLSSLFDNLYDQDIWSLNEKGGTHTFDYRPNDNRADLAYLSPLNSHELNHGLGHKPTLIYSPPNRQHPLVASKRDIAAFPLQHGETFKDVLYDYHKLPSNERVLPEWDRQYVNEILSPSNKNWQPSAIYVPGYFSHTDKYLDQTNKNIPIFRKEKDAKDYLHDLWNHNYKHSQ